MKKGFILVFLVFTGICKAQLTANSLFALPRVTDTELSTITSPNEGSVIYNTSQQSVWFRNGTSWQVMVPIKSLTTSDPFLTITTTNTDFEIATNFKDVNAELLFEDANYCYVSMTENTSDFVVIRYDKTDVNIEQRAAGTGAQPNTLAQVQGLTYN